MDFRHDVLTLTRDRIRISNPYWCAGSPIPIPMMRPEVVYDTVWNSILALDGNQNWNSNVNIKTVFLGHTGNYQLKFESGGDLCGELNSGYSDSIYLYRPRSRRVHVRICTGMHTCALVIKVGN